MSRISVLLLFLVLTWPVSAMRINADPRIIMSFMDKSISPELDILRVTTDISLDNQLVFQVKTKGVWDNGKDNDYLLLQILHEKTYALLIPLSREKDASILIYEGDLHQEHDLMSVAFSEPEASHTDFIVTPVDLGAEFTIPLDWINFGADFGFDAYTIQAQIQEDKLHINKIYDQARKGRTNEKQMSAITLLNKICSPKK